MQGLKIAIMREIPMCIHDYMVFGVVENLEGELGEFTMNMSDVDKYFANTVHNEVTALKERINKMKHMRDLFKTFY